MSSDDFSPLMNLHKDIKLAILKQLEFREYRNLALTCRNWYEIASTAPRSVKPIVKLRHVALTFYNFHVEDWSTAGNHMGEDFIPERLFALSIHNKFDLVNFIKIRFLGVKHGFLRDEYDPAVAYLLKNSDYFCIDQLSWEFHPEITLNKKLLRPLFGLTRWSLIVSMPMEFDDDNDQDPEDKLSPENRECIKQLIEEDRKLGMISSRISLPVELYKTVLDQVADGKRPNLVRFSMEYNDDLSMSFLTNVLKDLSLEPTSEETSDTCLRYDIITHDSEKFFVKQYIEECSLLLHKQGRKNCVFWIDAPW